MFTLAHPGNDLRLESYKVISSIGLHWNLFHTQRLTDQHYCMLLGQLLGSLESFERSERGSDEAAINSIL